VVDTAPAVDYLVSGRAGQPIVADAADELLEVGAQVVILTRGPIPERSSRLAVTGSSSEEKYSTRSVPRPPQT
jgi:hypothetical protein